MAKVKQIKSMQERLEELIVPKEQAPFAIPENWCWVRLFYLCQLQNGDKVVGDRLPYLDAKYLRGKSEGILKNEGVLLDKGQKVILVDGENSGEVFEIFERGYMGSTFRVLSINKNVNVDLIQYFISFHQDELRNNKIGSAIPHLNKELFYNLTFPYAPIAEQKRIVDKIESLFSRLDEAKELTQKSLDEVEDRKSAILNRVIMNGYDKISYRLVDIADLLNGNAFKSTEFKGSGIQVIRIGNLYNGILDRSRKPVFIEEHEKYKKYFVENGDILIALTGTKYKRDYGYATLYNDIAPCYINQRVLRIRAASNVINKYLFYYMLTQKFRDDFFSNETGGVNQGNVSSEYLKNIIIPVPNLNKQQEIVRILDNFFEKEDKSKELLDMIDQIEEMKKSILARAFRGELGTHSDDDEPAIELLRKILK